MSDAPTQQAELTRDDSTLIDAAYSAASREYRRRKDEARAFISATVAERAINALALTSPVARALVATGAYIITDRAVASTEQALARARQRGKRSDIDYGTYLHGAVPLVPGWLYKARGIEQGRFIITPSLRLLLRAAKLARMPVVITSGFNPNDTRPAHRDPGHSWDLRIKGLSVAARGALLSAVQRNGYAATLYGPEFGSPQFADHVHLNRIPNRSR